MDPYFMLALEVIRQAVLDTEHGTPAQRDKARADILNGGLDYWSDMVCLNRDTHRYLRDQLDRIVA